jgi:hypothetical protein
MYRTEGKITKFKNERKSQSKKVKIEEDEPVKEERV